MGVIKFRFMLEGFLLLNKEFGEFWSLKMEGFNFEGVSFCFEGLL